MLRNDLFLTFRRLRKNKLFSGINLFGLAFGLAVFMLILQYVAYEWSFNRMFGEGDRLVRVFFEAPDGHAEDYLPPAFGPAALNEAPAVQAMTRFCPYLGNGVFTVTGTEGSEQAFRQEGVVFVDGDFLALFDRPLLAGAGDLSQPLTMALPASTAKKYFGATDVVGRTVRVTNQFGDLTYTVTGVFEDLPANTDLQAEVLLAMQTLASAEYRNGNDWAAPSGWNNGFLNTYLLLETPAQLPAAEAQLTVLATRNNPGEELAMRLQPVNDMHLGGASNLPTFGNRAFVLFLLLAAVLILAIAWVNYVNLSTAQALRRAREISVRKVVGARRGQLVRQHLTETLLVVVMAFGLALLLVELLQASFNRMIGLELSLALLNRPLIWAGGLALIALTTLVAGAYVAFSLTRFRPVEALRGSFLRSGEGLRVRQALVVGQFVISIAFIAATFVMFRQLDFLRHRDLGVRLDRRLAVRGPAIVGEEPGRQARVFRDGLEQLPFLDHYSGSGGIPGTGYNFTADHIVGPDPQPGDEDTGYRMLMIDERYLETYAIDLVAGQNFPVREAEKGWDSDEVLINEAAAQALGFSSPAAAVGQYADWIGNPKREIIGVVRDYNHQSLHSAVDPIIFLPALNNNYFTLVLGPGVPGDYLMQLERLYRQAFPGNPFEYFFADEEFDRYYQAEQRMGWIFTAASLLAVFISCLGLFGLAVFSAEQRVKEVGIRKVLGAGVADIVALLSGSFLRPVLIATFLATPLAWYGMHRWLENFAYRTELSWWIFAAAGALALLIASATVSVQSLRVAMANPVESLRRE